MLRFRFRGEDEDERGRDEGERGRGEDVPKKKTEKKSEEQSTDVT